MTEEVLEGVDLNRGVTIRKDPKTGIRVCMYKDQPGIFMDIRGGVLPPAMAEKAGFDIDALKKQQHYNRELGDATSALSKKFEGVAEKEILLEIGEYRAIAGGKSKGDVYRGEHRMNTVPMTRKQAVELVEQLSENNNAEN